MIRTRVQVQEIANTIKNTTPIIHNGFECREVPKEFMTAMKGCSMNAINFEYLKKLMPKYLFSKIKGLPNYYAIKKCS